MLYGSCINIDLECIRMKDKNPNIFKKKSLYKKMDIFYIIAKIIQICNVNR